MKIVVSKEKQAEALHLLVLFLLFLNHLLMALVKERILAQRYLWSDPARPSSCFVSEEITVSEVEAKLSRA